jgi:eukaryotic-like serine/threonine-protein kinase
MSLSAGTRLGPYEILAAIGAGGMGEVYRAKDSRLGRTVAIKILPAELAGNADRLVRFQREAQSASALNHPNIVTIYEIGCADSVQFISMELVEGKSLRETLAAGALTLRKLIQVASQFADGLSKAHEAGIVHRDLKPENVMISKDGVVKILDFGLAKLTVKDSDSGSRPETQTDPETVLGTAGYTSPEQAIGGSVGLRSDQFSFGTILYEMATGKRAFKRATPAETLVAIIREEPEPVTAINPQVPAPLCWIIERCLAKDPEDRYSSTRDLFRDLQSIRDHISDITTSATSDLKTATPYWQKRYRLLALLPIILAAFLLGGTAAWKLFSPTARKPVAIRALTYSGLDTAPNTTPDGRLIAFTSTRGGKDRIWLRQMANGNEVALTEGPDDFARFSPDGSTVLFTRREAEHNSLYRVPALGGDARKIVENAESGDWAPDGKRIVFVRLEGQGEFENSILSIVDADGTNLQTLLQLKKTTLQWPHWSPDGRWIVANAYPPGNFKLENAILVIDAESKTTKWLPVFSTGHVSAVNWAGNSEQLLYEEQEIPIIGDRGLGSGNFLLQNTKSGKIRTLFWYPSMAASIQRVNGDQLLFDVSSVRENLREIASTLDAAQGVPRWLTRGNSNDRQPQYSPDGEWIIFSSDRNGNLDLWKLSTKTGGVRRITEDAARDWDPTFTPDGKHILWSSDRTGHFEIYIADADGNGARQLTSDGVDAENPTVTPDGRWIVHSSYNPNKSGLWKIHPDGSGATRFFSGVVQVPELSPDGKYVSVGIFKRRVNETSVTLEVIRMEDGTIFELQPGVTNSFTVSGGRCRWMPEGKRIAYLDINEQGAWGIYVQDFIPGQNTSSTRKPIAGFDPDSPTESFGISPDGSHITICQRENSSGLVLAENVSLN